MKLFNFEEILNELIASFPGNGELQTKLGLPLVDNKPIGNFECIAGALVETDRLPALITQLRLEIRLLQRLHDTEPDPDIERDLENIMTYTGRIVMLIILASTQKEVVPGIPAILMRSCVEAALPGYKDHLIVLIDRLLESRKISAEHSKATRKILAIL